MFTVSKNQQILIGIVLTLLVVMTRGHHFASVNALPSASLAVFLLAGFYLKPKWAFAAFLALCAGLDFYAITFASTNGFCVTPAYGFLLPAYGSMWLAGRWLNKHYSANMQSIGQLLAVSVIAGFVSELFSSGGFYFFGGRFAEPTLVEFGGRLVKYFPHQIENISFWLGLALLVHIIFTLANVNRRVKA